MKIEFLYSEVINFLKTYSLFKENVNERMQTLIDNGEIESGSLVEAEKQKYNDIILNNFHYSKLVKISFLEKEVISITGNDISIIDHDDNLIVGIYCAACGYIIFENKEDSFYEICPVCRWKIRE
ncbi:CPCC family cysteine-rich protein [Xenorhabdus bovienii]|uniref:Cysteine-rich CPCC domain-containing protein n=1 Tax=Xenorhabdus bovienii str. kraussei Becker Underwood TaxID=1398204 RepID=A0A077PIL3_XENBV|nr:CPCC family cysteine-rich protein [Xenorhabdus bovienii]CDH24200.1 conserved hypothetical protein [Xenorhabdus bovienii str. kraussei Becker Underwood]